MANPQIRVSSFPSRAIGKTLFLSPEDNNGGGSGGTTESNGETGKPKEKLFTQDEVNAIAARDRKNAEREAEKHSKALKAIREALELGDEADITEAIANLAKARKENNGKPKDGEKPSGITDEDVKKLLDKEAKKIRDEYEPKMQTLSKLELRVTDAEVITEAAKLGAVDPADFATELRGKIKYDPENDEFVILDRDGKVKKGERLQPMTIAEAVAEIAKAKPHWVSSKKLPGSGGGSNGGGNGGGPVDFNNMSQSEYEKGRKEGRW